MVSKSHRWLSLRVGEGLSYKAACRASFTGRQSSLREPESLVTNFVAMPALPWMLEYDS